jgi:sterol desaturase/sphingolipid hydroxylase (fatty acid hydroxylase superfamily)
MDETAFGTRTKRGDYKPAKPITYPPVFVWPPLPLKFLRWFFGFPGYIWPWNLLYAAIGILVWFYATPSLETMKSFAPGWIVFILVRNAALVLVYFGAFHLRLYIQRAQGTTFKYNPKWPSTESPTFLFHNQTLDNVFWTFVSAVPIWTAWECLTLWMFANHYLPFAEWAQNPVWFVVVFFLTPLFREVHFYAIHRLIHWPPLYRSVHKLHHKNVNPGPWSGLAMHPVEHLLYFSVVLFNWVVPSAPVHAIFTLVHTGLAPAPGHVGFDKVVVGEDSAFDTHSYEHYLHHKLFECNYADGVIPLDAWFDTFHDGSEESETRLQARLQARAAKRVARRRGTSENRP